MKSAEKYIVVHRSSWSCWKRGDRPSFVRRKLFSATRLEVCQSPPHLLACPRSIKYHVSGQKGYHTSKRRQERSKDINHRDSKRLPCANKRQTRQPSTLHLLHSAPPHLKADRFGSHHGLVKLARHEGLNMSQHFTFIFTGPLIIFLHAHDQRQLLLFFLEAMGHLPVLQARGGYHKWARHLSAEILKRLLHHHQRTSARI